MNCYDFDQTIFYPDSSYCFVMHCLRRYPGKVLRAAPGAAWAGLRHLLGRAETKEVKEKTFAFLRLLDDVDGEVARFWAENRGRIAGWYLRQRREDDLIISASPEFLLRPMAVELGFDLIATDMDMHSGKIFGKNCHDEEKVRRFREEYPRGHVEEFYSDSMSDAPMARLADKAFLVVKGETLRPWPEES